MVENTQFLVFKDVDYGFLLNTPNIWFRRSSLLRQSFFSFSCEFLFSVFKTFYSNTFDFAIHWLCRPNELQMVRYKLHPYEFTVFLLNFFSSHQNGVCIPCCCMLCWAHRLHFLDCVPRLMNRFLPRGFFAEPDFRYTKFLALLVLASFFGPRGILRC